MAKQRIWLPHSERIKEDEFERNKDKVECDEPYKPFSTQCPKCHGKIIVHCKECRKKITGCGCGLAKRIDSIRQEMWDRLFDS